jgi:Cys-Gly metallodipeptidase DUG1
MSYIDASAPAFIARFSEAVAIPSISGDPAFRPHVAMSDWLAAQLKAVGVTVKQGDLGTHVMDRVTLPPPPAILGWVRARECPRCL